MEKEKNYLLPAAGAVLALILYSGSICFRGMLRADEYEFALQLRHFIPQLSGTVIPKLPAALATWLTGVMLYWVMKKLNFRYPGCAAGLYWCFPPVWFIGTSASGTALMVLSILIAAAGLLTAHRSKKFLPKFTAVLWGLAGAAAAAYFAKCGFFHWTTAVMLFMPLIAAAAAIYLEKCENNGTAAFKIRKLVIVTAVALASLLAFLLLPSICRICKVEFPADLQMHSSQERLFRPALALLVPYLWLYVSLQAKLIQEKVFFLCFAIGFVLLTFPPALQWEKFSKQPSRTELSRMLPDLFNNPPAFFPVFYADSHAAAALEYNMRIPVKTVNSSDLKTDELQQEIKNNTKQRDVIVVSIDGELDSHLPPDLVCVKYTSQQNCRIFRFTGGTKK
ncbi:MAG: hypothetical protein E7057_00770 [Lentisphaerae bacterium]|nr:hypothetical protein [Lentisphaerota bacterium]